MQLTPRETEVLALLKTRKTLGDCARELGVKLGTFKQYSHWVYRVLGVSGRVELMAEEIEIRRDR